jgi:hypothetical protein
MKKLFENDFVKLILFILLVACGVLWSTHSNIINAAKYITETTDELSQEISRIEERQDLGLENNNEKIELLKWKKSRIYGFKNGTEKLDSPCIGHYMYFQNKGTEEEYKKFREKYYLSAEQINNEFIKAAHACHSKKITKKELNDITKKLKVKNNEIIDEVNKILNLNSIPKEKYCYESDINLENNEQRNSNNNIEIYEKIGVSKEAFDAWRIIDAEGYYPGDKEPPCSQEELDKIDNYCNTHNNECYEE